MIGRTQYRNVVALLMGLAALGAATALYGGLRFSSPTLFDVAVTLGLAAGLLVGVALTESARAFPAPILTTVDAGAEAPAPTVAGVAAEPDAGDPEEGGPVPAVSPAPHASRFSAARLRATVSQLRNVLPDATERKNLGVALGAAGLGATLLIRLLNLTPLPLSSVVEVGIASLLLIVGGGLAAIAIRYLSQIDSSDLPEAPGLTRAARVLAWVFLAAAASVGAQWLGYFGVARAIDVAIIVINISLAYGLVTRPMQGRGEAETFHVDLPIARVLGSRANLVGSVIDAAESQLGIDLRSSWALTVFRRSIEPLVIGLVFLGWLSTSLTVVGVDEQGLVERFGIPRSAPPLSPGLHAHLPWPIDRVIRLPVQRVQALTVGHEGQEAEEGPEDVLWARQHAANEYTLLLGNGRDLITIDAAVQYRIRDARAWQYHSQNPADALRAIAYRAVMRTTVNRTLADALSENLVALTARMRQMVQEDADALDLGVEILGFTVGGMHPPVMVALDYQSVVSAELGKVTAVVNARALRNRTVPYTETSAVVNANYARAAGVERLATAAGEAWSFLTLQAQYRAAPQDYVFRRRLETLEKGLANRHFTVLDARFQRDGGELWLTP